MIRFLKCFPNNKLAPLNHEAKNEKESQVTNASNDNLSPSKDSSIMNYSSSCKALVSEIINSIRYNKIPHNEKRDKSSEIWKQTAIGQAIKNPKKILIIDNDRLYRKNLFDLLTEKGHLCEEAINGYIGIELVKDNSSKYQNHSNSQLRLPSSTRLKIDPLVSSNDFLIQRQYDAIIVKIEMPGINGFDLTSSLFEIGYNGLIIGVSENADFETIDFFKKLGGYDVLNKPINLTLALKILE